MFINNEEQESLTSRVYRSKSSWLRVFVADCWFVFELKAVEEHKHGGRSEGSF